MNNEYIIVVAGGTGTRMNSTLPKQFMLLGGETVLLRTIRRFLAYNPKINIVLVVHPDFMDYARQLVAAAKLDPVSIQFAPGGATRFLSVKNGLLLVSNELAVVGIHDAARPFVSLQTIATCYRTASEKGSAVPCLPINESLRRVDSTGSCAVDRSEFRTVQTPQCFRVGALKAAFERGYDPAFTDDATVYEAAGGVVQLVEGNIENIKLTSPQDVWLAETLLKHE